MVDSHSIYIATPSIAKTLHSDWELRIELPFSTPQSSIYYLGLNHYENWATPSHTHSHFELCYLDEGRGQYKIDKTVYEIRSGQFLLTKPGENHFGLAGKNAPFKLYYIGFKLELLSALQMKIYEIGAHRIAEDTDGTMKSLFIDLIGEAHNCPLLAAPMAESLLEQLLIRALRHFHDQDLALGMTDKPLDSGILATMNKLHSEIRYHHDIDSLAAAIPMSRSHLARKFKHTIGITIGEYIRNLCLAKAKSELRATDKTISVIAEELGFNSIHAFSIFFKRFTAHSPTEYRKTNRPGKE